MELARGWSTMPNFLKENQMEHVVACERTMGEMEPSVG